MCDPIVHTIRLVLTYNHGGTGLLWPYGCSVWPKMMTNHCSCRCSRCCSHCCRSLNLKKTHPSLMSSCSHRYPLISAQSSELLLDAEMPGLPHIDACDLQARFVYLRTTDCNVCTASRASLVVCQWSHAYGDLLHVPHVLSPGLRETGPCQDIVTQG